ncbi:MAG: MerR family transcriptional regulator [Candidatus Thiodiazotropha taylori]|nr:MerR family transcriptional regulator [Candidatus Thiodiazotropha taylori]
MKMQLTIGMLSKATNVPSATLRSWERRYGIPSPERTPTGRRQYAEEQVAIVRELKARVDKGERISQAVKALKQTPLDWSNIAQLDEHQTIWSALQKQMIYSVERFDEVALNDVYNEALALFPVTTVTDSLLRPVLRTLGERWADRMTGVAEEHFFTAFLRAKIGALAHHQRAYGQVGPKLLLACLPDEAHEIGLLLFCLEATQQHFRCVCLGARTPLDQIESLANTASYEFDAVVLSATADPPPEFLASELQQVVQSISLPVFIGGLASVKHQQALVHAGLHVLGNEIEPALAGLQHRLRSTRYRRQWGGGY